jgi:[acyl-carrier-protein] S-malonyltransferase
MIAFIFPGQGSQNPGMGKDLADNFPAAKQVFEEADGALGFALSDLCFNGPAEALQLTENTQPAILTTSIAALRAMQAEDFPVPDFVAGHSLGEYSALVAATCKQSRMPATRRRKARFAVRRI